MDDQRSPFADHEAAQLERWRKLTPEERLRWLDQAKEFVARVDAARQLKTAQAKGPKT
jgi:hypothetical protein